MDLDERFVFVAFTAFDLCSKQEKLVVVAIAALAASVPNPTIHYTRAIGEITSSYFATPGGKRGDHNPSPGSLAQTREIRASRKWR